MKFTLLGIFEKGNRSIIQFDDMQDRVSLQFIKFSSAVEKRADNPVFSWDFFVYFMDIKFPSEMTRITKLLGKA